MFACNVTNKLKNVKYCRWQTKKEKNKMMDLTDNRNNMHNQYKVYVFSSIAWLPAFLLFFLWNQLFNLLDGDYNEDHLIMISAKNNNEYLTQPIILKITIYGILYLCIFIWNNFECQLIGIISNIHIYFCRLMRKDLN